MTWRYKQLLNEAVEEELKAYELQRWFDNMMDGTFKITEPEQLRDANELVRFGSTRKRYYVEDDEIKVARIDPTWPNENNERRFCVLKGRRVDQAFNMRLLHEAITRADPPRPWYALPQIERRTPTYLAVQILLDSYVN